MLLRSLSIVLVSLLLASDARAQFDPSFLPPRPGDDIGVYLTDVGGADFALQGIWRQRGNLNLGLRLGYMDLGTEGAIMVGAESWGLIAEVGEQFPLDASWTLGAGAIFNGGTFLEAPAGLSIGRTLDIDPVAVQLYAHPRLALIIVPDQADELSFEGLLDFGADAVLNENLKLRLGVTLGRIDAVGVGVAYRWTRGAVVR